MFSSDGTVPYTVHPHTYPSSLRPGKRNTRPQLNNPSIPTPKFTSPLNLPIVTPSLPHHLRVRLAPSSPPPRADLAPNPCLPGAPRGPRRPLGAPSLVGLQAHHSCTSAKSIHRIASASVNVLRVLRTTSFVLRAIGLRSIVGRRSAGRVLAHRYDTYDTIRVRCAFCGWMYVLRYIRICETSYLLISIGKGMGWWGGSFAYSTLLCSILLCSALLYSTAVRRFHFTFTLPYLRLAFTLLYFTSTRLRRFNPLRLIAATLPALHHTSTIT